MDSSSLLQRYRHDRRKLLEYLLSGEGLVKEIRTPSGPTTSLSNLNLDSFSADYVLQCIQSGGVVDSVQAARQYRDESARPIMMSSHTRDFYFLLSDIESAGSPPRRVPPPIMSNHSNQDESRNHMASQKFPLSGHVYDVEDAATKSSAPDSVENVNSLTLGLPSLITGLLDDDLQESAYEVLLVCMVLSGVEVQSIEGRKKEKPSRFLSALKNKKDKRHLRSQSSGRQLELIDTIRVQMQISESKDAVLRRQVVRFASGQAWDRVDLLHISLGLLNGGYRSDFLTEKSYIQWKNRHANILEELLSSANSMVSEKKTTGILLTKIRKANILEELLSSANSMVSEKKTTGILLTKIRNSEEGEVKMSYSERNEVLSALRQVAFKFSSMAGRFGIEGETYFWITGYHLNLRLYEKLLFGVFDTLDDDQLIEEVDEFLNYIKLTWSILGITQKLHNALYGWVLFQQFIVTGEALLLDHAIAEVQKVLRPEDSDGKEEEYIDNLLCLNSFDGCERQSNLVQSICFAISSWCDKKLQDYHLHFSQKASIFKKVVMLTLTVGSHNSNHHENIKSTESDASVEVIARKVKTYVEKSVKAACKRVTEKVTLGSEMDSAHPLALLASELRLIVERELSLYFPVLRRWYPEAGMVTAIKLHHFYGEKLKPFLNDVSCLSEDVRAVLPAADMLERCLFELYSSACKENSSGSLLSKEFNHYKIGEISRPIILDWVIAQHARVLEWTGRAFDLEEWEPLSSQQRQAPSAVEVFRILEETLDQLFELGLPMDITHLQALVSIIFHTLDAYLSKMISQFVDKHNLYPPLPPLTRYNETAFPILKRKLVNSVVLENEVNDKLSRLTVSKLCIRLNTLHYIQKQISVLEDGIRRSWTSVRKYENHTWSNCNNSDGAGTMDEESVDELFVATFDCIRDAAAAATRKLCDFVGTRIVFWDLREEFLNHLYHGGVEYARLDRILPQFDSVLNQVCGLIDDTLKDLVVSNVCKASLEGFVWVLLDGGPARAFSDSDITMIEEDLNMLKDLFIADGEGLPRSLVDEEAKFAHQVLSLFSLETESVIQLLMTSSESIRIGLDACEEGQRFLYDAHTLIRVLCHKKDREASKFLKQQYQLPASSEYNESPSEDSNTKSPLVADFLKRSASFHWTGKGNSSFKSFRKKLQDATSEIRNSAW